MADMHELHTVGFSPKGSFLPHPWALHRGSGRSIMDCAMSASRCCAAWVRVRPSTLKAEGAGLGLFVALPACEPAADAAHSCPYGVDEHGLRIIRKGSWVGLYRGQWKRRTTGRPYSGVRASHTVETDDFFIVPPRAVAADMLVNVHDYRMAALQEVPEGQVANVAFVRWCTVGDVVESPPAGLRHNAKADAVALYTVRDLHDGEELFTHYGSAYPRTWVAGRPGRLLKKDVQPPRLVAAYVPADAWAIV